MNLNALSQMLNEGHMFIQARLQSDDFISVEKKKKISTKKKISHIIIRALLMGGLVINHILAGNKTE